MDYSDEIVDLYSAVFDFYREKNNVGAKSIKAAIRNMWKAYSPNPNWQIQCTYKAINYNSASHRCAYLHKYAMVHTGLLCEILQSVFRNSEIFMLLNNKFELNLCSLGGGPGTDVVSLLLVVREIFGLMKCNVSVVDNNKEWEQVFASVVSELKTGLYGKVSDIVADSFFSYEYLTADLLSISPCSATKGLQGIQNADIITMIKFISAVACDKTTTMIKEIFRSMKTDALVLFVDNAGGGFRKIFRDAALECGMQNIISHKKPVHYQQKKFSLLRFNSTSQSETKVSVELWKKPQLSQDWSYHYDGDLYDSEDNNEDDWPSEYDDSCDLEYDFENNSCDSEYDLKDDSEYDNEDSQDSEYNYDSRDSGCSDKCAEIIDSHNIEYSFEADSYYFAYDYEDAQNSENNYSGDSEYDYDDSHNPSYDYKDDSYNSEHDNGDDSRNSEYDNENDSCDSEDDYEANSHNSEYDNGDDSRNSEYDNENDSRDPEDDYETDSSDSECDYEANSHNSEYDNGDDSHNSEYDTENGSCGSEDDYETDSPDSECDYEANSHNSEYDYEDDSRNLEYDYEADSHNSEYDYEADYHDSEYDYEDDYHDSEYVYED